MKNKYALFIHSIKLTWALTLFRTGLRVLVLFSTILKEGKQLE